MVLLTVGNSDGERRCDARCYNATSATCDCVCHGMNHGVGIKQAKQNTEVLAEEWLDKIAEKQGITKEQLKYQLFPDKIAQGELF